MINQSYASSRLYYSGKKAFKEYRVRESYMNTLSKWQISVLCGLLLTVVACNPRSISDGNSSSLTKTALLAGSADPRADDYSIRGDEPLLPAPKGYVNDFADILDTKTKEELEQTLINFKQQAEIDFVIATVKTTGDKTAFDYSLELAKQWAIGAKNPDKAGILLLISVEDRKWHIQITHVLEKILSDNEVEELGSLMNSPFKENKYGDGVKKCVEEFIEVLTKRRVKK